MRDKGDIAVDIAKALFKRKTTMGRVNKAIDAFAEDNPALDECLHFVNEVVVHKQVKRHVRNTLKYHGIEKIIGQMLK